VNAGRSGHSIGKGVFFLKKLVFQDLTPQKVTDSGFFYPMDECKNSGAVRNILKKKGRLPFVEQQTFFLSDDIIL